MMNKPLSLTAHICRSVFAGSLILTVMGCGSSTPSSSDIERALGKSIPNCSTDYVTITNVKKTNGIASGQSYKVSYSCDLEFLKDSPDYDEMAKTMDTMAISDPKREAVMLEMICWKSLVTIGVGFTPGKPPTKGYRSPMTGEMIMAQSEQGWVQQ